MNIKQPNDADHQPVFLHEVQINGKTLRKGGHAELSPLPGRKQNRDYKFVYATMLHRNGEDESDDTMLLVFDGPVRSTRQRWRYAHLHEVLRVR
jgi:hypothetical protein